MKPERSDYEPIGSYALISDSQGSALVSRSGSIDWACLPRFDSGSIFCRLLDGRGGEWTITPAGRFRSSRCYLDGTMVLQTTFVTSTGSVSLTDAMPFEPGEQGHEIGASSPHAIVRVVEGLTGDVELVLQLSPRPEYGLTVPDFASHGQGWRTSGGPQTCIVSSAVRLDPGPGSVRGRFTIAAGERLAFAVRVCSPWRDIPQPWSQDEIFALLHSTVSSWRSWSQIHEGYEGAYQELVRHSGRVLQALTYAPTGAIVAAPTTSLPEVVGGVRNWDYRFSWVRDASLTIEALWVAACPDESRKFFDFFATAAGALGGEGSSLQILYGVEGERRVPEAELNHLGGYRASRPVRVGNDAWYQLQLDVYGELLSAACLLADRVGDFGSSTSSFLAGLADEAAAKWQDPDQGIWEVRGGPRHFLYSKLMCWVALDRAVRLAPRLDALERVAGWEASRDEIKAAILAKGWSDRAGAYTQSFGSDDLDASVLMIPLVQFLPAEDPRMLATIEAVRQRLTDERGFVFRYRREDGLPGKEGTFTICTFWLVQCLALLGRTPEARTLFERVVGHTNDIGLLAEQIEPESGELLGNFPQAFTHIGLINAAWAITEAEARAE